jgi:hypothetical protein
VALVVQAPGLKRPLRASAAKWTLVAVNHWPLAIETHHRNHPTARHYVEDVTVADPVLPSGAERQEAHHTHGRKVKVTVMTRTLYECSHAKVYGIRIQCECGHKLGGSDDGALPSRKLARGDALECRSCQKCPDFDLNGLPVPKKARGWQIK